MAKKIKPKVFEPVELMFGLTSTDKKKLERWLKKMRKKKSDIDYFTGDRIGSGLVYMFSPTGIGDVVRVKDELTGEVLDLTDYDSW